MAQNFTGFPATINDGFAPGAPGDFVNVQPRLFTTHNYLVASDVTDAGVVTSQVRAGNFAWLLAADSAVDPDRGPLAIGRVPDGAAGAAALPAGIVKRWLRYPGEYMQTAEADLLVIPAGYPAEIVEYGSLYVQSSTEAARDDMVYASDTDGSIATAAEGAAAPAGHTATDWRVVDGGAAGEIITVTRWIPAR